MELLKQLKNLLKIPGNRVIIVEQGKPAYVMTTIEDYLRLVSEKNPVETGFKPVSTDEEETVEDWQEEVNRVLAEVAEKESVKEEPAVEQDEEEAAEMEEEMEELKIEDLPF